MTPPFVSLTTLCGFIAKWATQQSPYHCPDGLVEVVRQFYSSALSAKLTEDWCIDSWPCILATRENLRAVLHTYLLSQAQVISWNNRKNGRDGHQFVSRYDKPGNPDDDFIDLDALVMNIVKSCIDEDKMERGQERNVSEITVSN